MFHKCVMRISRFTLCFTASAAMEKKIRRVRTQTQKHLDWYARDGLRTLCIAKKVILFLKKNDSNSNNNDNYFSKWLILML